MSFARAQLGTSSRKHHKPNLRRIGMKLGLNELDTHIHSIDEYKSSNSDRATFCSIDPLAKRHCSGDHDYEWVEDLQRLTDI
jgi:hypothetical protein